MKSRGRIAALALVMAATAACATDATGDIGAAERRTRQLGPAVDHHQHLLSPASAALLAKVEGRVLEPVEVPEEVSEILARRAAAWNDAAALANLFSDDAVVLDAAPVSGKSDIAAFLSRRFGRPYEIAPLAYGGTGSTRQVAAMYTRSGSGRIGLALFTLARDSAGRWRIVSEAMKFPAPAPAAPLDADMLVRLLDEASIERAVIMSSAYFYESPFGNFGPEGAAMLRAENDWTAAQIARHSRRLIGFCGVNPLTDQAIPEITRCKQQLGMAGVKLHFGNSMVDLEKPDHLAKVKALFAAADRLGMPVAVHLWTPAKRYGRRDAEIFLSDALPAAPNVVVQIMHMAGGGPGWTDEALEVFAQAVASGDRRTRNLYFDVATVADLQTADQLQLLAQRIRQIGPRRILYGSDAAGAGRNTPDQEWGTFRGMVPLTDAEFAIIRNNVAPYLR